MTTTVTLMDPIELRVGDEVGDPGRISYTVVEDAVFINDGQVVAVGVRWPDGGLGYRYWDKDVGLVVPVVTVTE